MAVRSAVINVMAAAARKAGRGLIRDFGEVENLQVSQKGPSDFVSTADLKAEKTLRQELEKARPGYGFMMEESAETIGDGHHRWIVDPLDGTLNFLHGIPHFCISVALERDGEIVAGVVYEPLKDEEFWAEKGSGAFVSDRRIRVSGRRDLGQSVIGTGMPFRGKEAHPGYARTLNAVMAETAGVRRMGAAALDLAYVAAGRFDGFWEFGLKPWDMAAGLLLVKEAGGYCSEPDGSGHDMMKTGNVLAANDHLHLPLGRLMRQALK
ncbi:MAG TPA: inositol monophosphatase family protein [Aliidongia sp.]|uniref:inositol monophosphatase family protein n=1 Tax=Aliidongia sp. TaxID=1914230 RepID=UPI002DDD63DB|nr:inositol monophosphatase family protein [Aliidongia sp.]HEV2676603.1 inositol monophosphatase family protein [Aliidongia sp.]